VKKKKEKTARGLCVGDSVGKITITFIKPIPIGVLRKEQDWGTCKDTILEQKGLRKNLWDFLGTQSVRGLSSTS